MHIRHGLVVDTLVETLLDFAEHFDGAVGMLHGMDCRRYDAKHDLAFGNDGIYDNGAEYTIVLTQIDDNIRALIDIAREEDRRNRRLGAGL